MCTYHSKESLSRGRQLLIANLYIDPSLSFTGLGIFQKCRLLSIIFLFDSPKHIGKGLPHNTFFYLMFINLLIVPTNQY
jgi:hypothetical protein